MARVKDPVLFSKEFGIDPELIAAEGLIDPFLNVDTQLFVDPILLQKSSIRMISKNANQRFRKNFENFLRLIAISEKKRDAPWRAAERLLDLSEPPENGLGYGNSGRSGSSRPEKVRAAIMTTAKQIMRTGANDPEMISLMGFFEEDVGPDTISDYTTRVISEQLASVTQAFCKKVGVQCFENDLVGNSLLPKFVDDKGRERFVVLVPRDIVRELPVAADWNGIEEAIAHSERIRTAVNSYLAGIARPTVAERKDALKSIALQSKEAFNELLSAVKEHTTTYDPNLDALGYYRMKDIFASGYEGAKKRTML